jgi:aryl-phospho-beta-D-glucosidase BglC (GH1 family)
MRTTKFPWGRTFAAAALFLAAACGPGQVHAMTSPLHVDGADIKDASGRTVILRGVNWWRYLYTPDGDWGPERWAPMLRSEWNPDAVKAQLDELHHLGFNVVRLHTLVDWWKQNPDSRWMLWHTVKYPEPYRAMLKDTIRWAAERDLYVIFDFYGMKTVAGINTGQESLPWPPYNRYPDVVGSREQFLDLWLSVARELGGLPNVLFEFFNEPHGDAKAQAEWLDFSQQAITALRAETSNPIIVQWDYCSWVFLNAGPRRLKGSTLAWIDHHPMQGANIIYGTHLYRHTGGPPQSPGMVNRFDSGMIRLWDRPDVDRALELIGFEHVLLDLHHPILVTEIGASVDEKPPEEEEHELAWYRNTLAALNDLHVGYVGWAWSSTHGLIHRMLKDGTPNRAGQEFLDAVHQKSP